ncbi:hypothetical protein DQ353_20500 [Arthrobacter sp. AQ5-05]|nr:hypothetical protein DQ353_20500 [Arthrobacter sp. AQ5-05]
MAYVVLFAFTWTGGKPRVAGGSWHRMLTAALFDDEAATEFDDGPGKETPLQEDPGGASMAKAAAWSSPAPGAAIR